MNNNDEQLDQFLRLQFAQKKFVQKEQYWNKAQQLIAVERANSSKEYISALFSAVLLIGLSVGMLWNSGNTKAVAQQENTTSVNHNFFASNVSNQSTVNSANLSSTDIANYTGNAIDENSSTQQPSSALGFNKAILNGGRDTKKPKNNRNVNRNSNNDVLTETVLSKPNIAMQRLGSSSHTTYFPVNGLEPLSKKNQYSEVVQGKQKRFIVMEAGLNAYNIGMNDLEAINGHIGIRYYHFVAPKWGLSAGLTYAQIHQQLDARNFDNINFGFGQENNQTTIETKQIDYLEIPVSVHYNITGKHFINAGATFAYAIQAKSEVSSLQQETVQQAYGYLDAINRKDVQLNIGYSFMAGQKWIITSAYHYGLMDVSNNTKFKSNSFDRNSGIRITLGYKLF